MRLIEEHITTTKIYRRLPEDPKHLTLVEETEVSTEIYEKKDRHR